MSTVLRKEIKYVIYRHEFGRMRPTLHALMRPDIHGGNFGYPIRSLYFDSIYDQDLYDSIDGHLIKSKVRLRTYGPNTPIKLELKQKEGSDGRKENLLLSRAEADCMQRGVYDFLRDRPEAAARTIYMKMVQGAYQPKTLVEYEREAYVYPAGDVRVTFDTDMRATATVWDLFAERPSWTTIAPAGTGVLEVKYTSFLPSFLKSIVETDRLAVANSKYMQARQLYQFGGDAR